VANYQPFRPGYK